MDQLYLTDKTFDPERSENQILSIRFSPDGFSFCIIDSDRMIPLLYSSHPINAQTSFHLKNEINAFLHQQPILTFPYKKTIISYCNGRQLIAPDDIIDSNQLNTVFYSTFVEQADEKLLNFNLKELEATLIFAVPFLLVDFFSNHFNNPVFIPDGLPFLQLASNINNQGMQIWGNRTGHILYLAASSSGLLTGFNTYYIKDETDLLYFTAAFSRQFETTNTIAFFFTGDLEPGSTLFNQLRKYSFQPTLVQYPITLGRNHQLSKQPDHRMVLLTQQCLCV
jgi:hypothetical protein